VHGRSDSRERSERQARAPRNQRAQARGSVSEANCSTPNHTPEEKLKPKTQPPFTIKVQSGFTIFQNPKLELTPPSNATGSPRAKRAVNSRTATLPRASAVNREHSERVPRGAGVRPNPKHELTTPII